MRRKQRAQPAFARREQKRQKEWQKQLDSPAFNARQAFDDLFLQAQGLPWRLKTGWGLVYAKAKPGGDPIAIQEYAKLVCEHVEKLNFLIESHKKHLLPVSQKRFTWPILKSEHPHFSQDEKKILNALEVGKGTGRFFDKYSKWKPGGLIAYLVDELLSWVEACKDKGKYFYTTTIMRKPRLLRGSAVELLYDRDSPHTVVARLRKHLAKHQKAAASLKPLTQDSINEWEKFFTALLTDCFKDARCAQLLSKVFVKAESRKKKEGRYGVAKQHLIRKVCERLRAFAGVKRS